MDTSAGEMADCQAGNAMHNSKTGQTVIETCALNRNKSQTWTKLVWREFSINTLYAYNIMNIIISKLMGIYQLF